MLSFTFEIISAILVGGAIFEKPRDLLLDGHAGTAAGLVILAGTVALLWTAGRRDRV